MLDRFLEILRRILYRGEVELVPGRFEAFLAAPVLLEDLPARWQRAALHR